MKEEVLKTSRKKKLYDYKYKQKVLYTDKLNKFYYKPIIKELEKNNFLNK